MAPFAQLFRGCRQKHEAFGGLAKFFCKQVFRAVFHKVVGLIHDDHVPACVKGLLLPLSVLKEINAADSKLGLEKRVGFGITLPGCGTEFIVKNPEQKIESSEQLHKPLVDQGVGHEDEHAADSFTEKEPVQNQAGLDGFSKSYFIGKKDPRKIP